MAKVVLPELEVAAPIRNFIYFFNKTHRATGAPVSAVTELIGNAPSNPGSRAIRLHIKARLAPAKSVAGRRMRWSAVLNSPLQI